MRQNIFSKDHTLEERLKRIRWFGIIMYSSWFFILFVQYLALKPEGVMLYFLLGFFTVGLLNIMIFIMPWLKRSAHKDLPD